MLVVQLYTFTKNHWINSEWILWCENHTSIKLSKIFQIDPHPRLRPFLWPLSPSCTPASLAFLLSFRCYKRSHIAWVLHLSFPPLACPAPALLTAKFFLLIVVSVQVSASQRWCPKLSGIKQPCYDVHRFSGPGIWTGQGGESVSVLHDVWRRLKSRSDLMTRGWNQPEVPSHQQLLLGAGYCLGPQLGWQPEHLLVVSLPGQVLASSQHGG